MRFGLRILNTWKENLESFWRVPGSLRSSAGKSLGNLLSGTAWTLVSLPTTFEELRMVRFVHCGLLAYSTWVRFSCDLVFDERVCAENLMQVSRLLRGHWTLCIVRF
jgi:hypothetical protein